jgi:hypothetical protein
MSQSGIGTYSAIPDTVLTVLYSMYCKLGWIDIGKGTKAKQT